MATTLMNDRIPCRYVIVKYVEDEVRNEPINVGVIIQSNRDYTTFSKFVTEYSNSKLKNVPGENIVLLKEIWSNIERTISSKHKEKNTLDTIISKFEGKLRFTEPRGTLASNLSSEIQYLFDRYVATKKSKILIKEHSTNNYYMTEDIIEKVIHIGSSTNTDVATVTTQIVRSSTQQLNTESVTIQIK